MPFNSVGPSSRGREEPLRPSGCYARHLSGTLSFGRRDLSHSDVSGTSLSPLLSINKPNKIGSCSRASPSSSAGIHYRQWHNHLKTTGQCLEIRLILLLFKFPQKYHILFHENWENHSIIYSISLPNDSWSKYNVTFLAKAYKFDTFLFKHFVQTSVQWNINLNQAKPSFEKIDYRSKFQRYHGHL